ncbi:MAG: hypothetical protein WC455_19905 [Dehalococcoidia bacterium]
MNQATPLSQIEEDFKELCKTWIFFDLPMKPGRYVMLLSPQRMKELMLDTMSQMQEDHLLELDTDPRQLDGAHLDQYEPGEEHELDTRTCRTNQYDGLMAPLPHEIQNA